MAATMDETDPKIIGRIRLLLWFFIAALVLSGLTAFPLRWEITILYQVVESSPLVTQHWPAMAEWITDVYQGITTTYDSYPFIAYGTDWLAFAHLVIAIAFIGPLRDPVKNEWVVEFGMIACVLVIPLAMIFGPIRGIPFFWRAIDSAFGIFGFILLWVIHRDIQQLAEKGSFS